MNIFNLSPTRGIKIPVVLHRMKRTKVTQVTL